MGEKIRSDQRTVEHFIPAIANLLSKAVINWISAWCALRNLD